MQENYWIHTKTNQVLGGTGKLGNPRSWLKRALDINAIDDLYSMHESSLHPSDITVAGIWRDRNAIPEYDAHSLFRFFKIPPAHAILKPRYDGELESVTGMAIAAPINQVMQIVQQFRATGAEWIWWSKPIKRDKQIVFNQVHTKIDHKRVMELLEQGKSRTEIGIIMGINSNNVDYIKKKWLRNRERTAQGLAPLVDKRTLPKTYGKTEQMWREYTEQNYSVPELARKYELSPSYLYGWVKRMKGKTGYGKN